MLQLTRITAALVVAAFLATGAFAEAKEKAPIKETALDRYVAKPDPTYKYELVKTIEDPEFKCHILHMTSQTWRTAEEVDRPVWEHDVTIVVPTSVDTETAMLYIDGGKNGGAPPDGPNPLLTQIALITKGIVCNVRQIPNEYLTFKEDGKERTEDEIIAFTWKKYMETGDEEWPLRLPMTKGAVRALDTIQDFLKKPENGGTIVKDFVVSGGSKRGWTTWAIAAVDPRVKAIIPAVIDVLNVVPSFKHHYSVYGFWAPAVGDYVNEGIMDWMGSKEYDALLAIEDPYSYRDRYTMPKYIVNASGDQFFLPDSSQFYFDRLRAPKYLRYVPNGDHGLDDTDAPSALITFYSAIAHNTPLPRFVWSFPDKGSIRVTCEDKPTEVKLWQATNPDARDFRVETLGKKWTESALLADDNGAYIAKIAKPEKGWTAAFVELSFPGPHDTPFKFTTPVRVVPDVLPHKYELPAVPKKGFLSKDK
jgi:PhoPQ-activated pathogenicity-related protein